MVAPAPSCSCAWKSVGDPGFPARLHATQNGNDEEQSAAAGAGDMRSQRERRGCGNGKVAYVNHAKLTAASVPVAMRIASAARGLKQSSQEGAGVS